MSKAPFIVIEGIDGSGKTTHSRLLINKARERFPQNAGCLTTEPSIGPVGRFLRESVLNEASLDELSICHLFAADRHDHLIKKVEPALGRGEYVISDRYVLSTAAYQGSGDHAMSMDQIMAIHGGFRKPDLTIYLHLSPDVALDRMKSRGKLSRYENPKRLEQIYAAYSYLTKAYHEDHNIGHVDADASKEVVAARIWDTASTYFGYP